jgi:hypothetical protein
MLSFALVVAAAVPDAGTTWTWTVDDERSVKVEKSAENVSMKSQPGLRDTELVVTVLETTELAPSKLRVQVVQGGVGLKGRTFRLESNYGEPVLTEEVKDASNHVLTQVRKASADLVRVLQRNAGTLLQPDPVVQAAAGKPPCDEATQRAVAEAAARSIATMVQARSEELTVQDASASCMGKGPAWKVGFSLVMMVEDQPQGLTFSGTVSIPKEGWRATLAVTGSGRFEVGSGRTRLVARAKNALRSTMTPRSGR